MKAKDFKKQIDALNLCYYLVNHLDSKEKKDRIFDMGEIIYKEIIQEAVLAGCEIKYFDKNDTGFYYIRTENINDKLHSQIVKIIDKSKSYKEISAKIKELGYKGMPLAVDNGEMIDTQNDRVFSEKLRRQ